MDKDIIFNSLMMATGVLMALSIALLIISEVRIKTLTWTFFISFFYFLIMLTFFEPIGA